MKKISILLLLLVSGLCNAQKTRPLPDSFAITPGYSTHIDFNQLYKGEIRRDSDRFWTLQTGKVAEPKTYYASNKFKAQSKRIEFKDAVYFNPQIQACDARFNSRQFHTRFFIADFYSEHMPARELVPSSVRFYLPVNHLTPDPLDRLSCDTFPVSLVHDYVRPFYFRKYEVTNKEYREFVHYVRDSVARTKMKYFNPDGTVNYKIPLDILNPKTDSILHFQREKELLLERTSIESDSFFYRFKSKQEAACPSKIKVYPDTTAWIYDFTFSYNEPMSDFYFWHPAYDDYPVCGVSYWQCLAFLEWKSMMMNKQYSGKKVKITCALPSEIEWDYVTTAERIDDQLVLIGPAYTSTCDASWLTDLYLRSDSQHYIIQIQENAVDKNRSEKRSGRVYQSDKYNHPLRNFHLAHAVTYGDLIMDGYFHTGPAELKAPSRKEMKNYKVGDKKITAFEQYGAHYDNATGISWMDGNVSEWMREDLDLNWRGVFEKHLQIQEGPYMKERQIIREYEKMYYDRLPEHGKLVRGSNWFDERFALHFGKNVEGMQAKTFCDPDAQHCTLGFRYVIYVEAY